MYSGEVKKTEVLGSCFRRAIGMSSLFQYCAQHTASANVADRSEDQVGLGRMTARTGIGPFPEFSASLSDRGQ